MPAAPLITTLGAGADLVLVPGWAMGSAAWGPLVEQLARRHRLHLLELPGQGQAADGDWRLDGLLDALPASLPPATWLGWSLGGLLALRAAQRIPRRVTGLVLLGATPCFVARPYWPQGMPAEMFAAFETGLARDPARTVRRFMALAAGGDLAALRQLRALPQAGRAGLASGLAVLAGTDLRDALPGLTQPTLWLHGSEDRVVAAAAAQAAAGLMPHARCRLLEGAGHAPHLAQPDAVAAAVDALQAGRVAA